MQIAVLGIDLGKNSCSVVVWAVLRHGGTCNAATMTAMWLRLAGRA